MKSINRDSYLQKLIDRRENGLIKIITGIYGCGKSYLLFNIFYNYLLSNGIKQDHIICMALDEENNRKYRKPNELYNYLYSRIAKDKEMFYILIDEAQLAIEDDELHSNEPIRLYGILNGLLHKNNVDVYITGSNSKFLSSDIMTEFRGRGDEVHVNPLSFAEFMSVYEGDKNSGYAIYSRYGGLPFVLSKKQTSKRKSI